MGRETIAALSTAPGKAGVAVVRVAGEGAFSVLASLTGRRPEPGRIAFAAVRTPDATRTLLDRCVVLAFAAPHGYTGEDAVEFQCHGGTVTPRRILEACYAAGARPARRGEFTERAFLNGKMALAEAEAVIDLIDAKTSRAADAALAGLSGAAARRVGALYGAALDLAARIAHALDIDESELPDGFTPSLARETDAFLASLDEAVRREREGKILREGALVVLSGAPNAGKSSLLNALLEEGRAIVSATPGTTRDLIEDWIDLDGWPVRLVDTAGLRETDDEIEAEGVRRTIDAMRRADVVVRLVPAGTPDAAFAATDAPVVTVTSKCDVARGPGLNVSSATGEGLDELKKTVAAHLAEKALAPDEASGADGREERLAAFLAARRAVRPFLPVTDATDLVLLGDAFRTVGESLGRLSGAVYTDDLLERVFSRFCVGK